MSNFIKNAEDGATKFVRLLRKGNDRRATWFDVSEAYMAGFKDGQLRPEFPVKPAPTSGDSNNG